MSKFEFKSVEPVNYILTFDFEGKECEIYSYLSKGEDLEAKIEETKEQLLAFTDKYQRRCDVLKLVPWADHPDAEIKIPSVRLSFGEMEFTGCGSSTIEKSVDMYKFSLHFGYVNTYEEDRVQYAACLDLDSEDARGWGRKTIFRQDFSIEGKSLEEIEEELREFPLNFSEVVDQQIVTLEEAKAFLSAKE